MPPSAIDQTPTPALTWTHLFPAASHFACAAAAPKWFAEQIAGHATGGTRTVGIAWGASPDIPDSAEHCGGVAAINCRRFPDERLSAMGFGYVRHFAVLPNLQHARWFIPLDSPAVSSAALSLYTPSRASAKFKRLVARTAMHARLPIWYRDHIWIAQPTVPPLETSLAALFPGREVRVALSSGAPQGARNRKASAMVIGTDGAMLAFAKLARSQIARRIAANESAVLGRLALMNTVSAGVPRILFDDEIDGTRVMAQTPLGGRPAPVGITAAHRTFLDGLQSGDLLTATQASIVFDLPRRLAALALPRADLLSILEEVSPILRKLELPATVIHGDFAPWNLRLHDGALGAFDWEYGLIDGLPLIDEMHYCLQSGWLLKDWDTEAAINCLDELACGGALGLSIDQIRAIEVVYLVDALARLLEEGYTPEQDVVAWHQRILDRIAPLARVPREGAVA